ncbi:transposase InsO family protein [Rhodobium orientis]|nr:Mu transposase C-terminal domain-containing protein [Rhodobium orientis]MBB4302318.1 transposase InsO family protein [Rhodobium orientis]
MTAPTNKSTKDWLSAKEIADLKLSSLAKTVSGIIRYASREGWNDDPARCRDRKGRGGGLEYHVSLLPTLARLDYEKRFMVVGEVEPTRLQPDLPTPETDRARRSQEARLAILVAYDRFGGGLNLRETGRTSVFVDSYNMGHLKVDDWVRAEVPKLSRRTLARWRAAREKCVGLGIDHSQARKGTGLLDAANDGRVKTYVLGLIAYQPHIKAERVRTLVQAEFGDTLTDHKGKARPVPPVRTFQHTIRGWKAAESVVLTQLSNPDFYRSTMAPAGVGVLRHIKGPNVLWMIDASPLDAMDTSGSRATVYACIDIGTRRTQIAISRTPRASAVALLIRKAILAWGVPEKIKTDNGSDFVADDTKRLFDALGIEMELSDAYSPAQKGHVERVIRTFQHNFSELLPGYIGHSVTDRKRLEDRKNFAERLGLPTAELFGVTLSMSDIQGLADRWIDAFYEHQPHSALGGKTPAQAAAEANVAVRTVDPRALDVLLMPVAEGGGTRTVTKLGVRVGGFYYQTMAALPGDRVFVRLDPNDLGLVYLFDADTRAFIEPAVCPERAGVDPAKFMAMVKRKRAELLAERGKDIRDEVKRITSGPALIELYLGEKEKERAAEADNVVQLPTRSIDYTTPDIAAALSAATGERHEAPAETPLEAPGAPAEVVAFKPKVPVAKPAGNGRPAFQNDQEMAAWLLENPQQMTERDRLHMAERLDAWTFREMLPAFGVSADALAALIKDKKTQGTTGQ